MEKNTVETAENVSRERDSELSNDIAKVQGISSKADEFEIGE